MAHISYLGFDPSRYTFLTNTTDLVMEKVEDHLCLAPKDYELTIVCPQGMKDPSPYSPLLIPEYKMGGALTAYNKALIAVDQSLLPLPTADIARQFHALLAHEIHHIKRMHSPVAHGNRVTLGLCAVMEGLAQAFEGEETATLPFYAFFASEQGAQNAFKQVRPLIEVKRSENLTLHNSFFFGGGEWPRHAGYSFGYSLVHHWMKSTGTNSAKAAFVDGNEVLGWWKQRGSPYLAMPTRDKYQSLKNAPFVLDARYL